LLSTRKRVISRYPSIEEYINAVVPLLTEIRKIERNSSGAQDFKHHVLGVEYSSFVASTFAPLSTRKREISRCPSFEDSINAVQPLIPEFRKNERTCSGAQDFKHHVLGVEYPLSVASTFAPLSTRKREISRCPPNEERINAVIPLIPDIRKNERN
jgi:hypothetical protein